MTKITINQNNDTIEMYNEVTRDRMDFDINGSISDCRNFLIELFNVLNISGIILEEINEDERRIVDEW